MSCVTKGRYTLSAQLTLLGAVLPPWWLTVVYGPQMDTDKVEFLEELERFRDGKAGNLARLW